jgi:hypothetical protein
MVIECWKMGCVGHTAGLEERANTDRFLVGKPGGKRTVGRFKKCGNFLKSGGNINFSQRVFFPWS